MYCLVFVYGIYLSICPHKVRTRSRSNIFVCNSKSTEQTIETQSPVGKIVPAWRKNSPLLWLFKKEDQKMMWKEKLKRHTFVPHPRAFHISEKSFFFPSLSLLSSHLGQSRLTSHPQPLSPSLSSPPHITLHSTQWERLSTHTPFSLPPRLIWQRLRKRPCTVRSEVLKTSRIIEISK